MTDERPSANPYDFIGDVKDRSLFAGRRSELASIREELARLTAPQPISPVIALVGERRVGKTSLLHRISEACSDYEILPCWINLTTTCAADGGEFWLEVLRTLLLTANRVGAISLSPGAERWSALPHDIGFRAHEELPRDKSQDKAKAAPLLSLIQWYNGRPAAPSTPPTSMVSEDLKALRDIVVSAHYKGIVLMLDEAHLLLQSLDVVQQLRYALRGAPNCGLIFTGERTLNQMFTDPTAPFYLQACIIAVQNFVAEADVTECALLPLKASERPLMNPMTIKHLHRLSRGKPNQIRLICHSIYRRYQRNEQQDLNITIGALDNVLEDIQASYESEYDLKQRVDTIRRLNSVDLETLYLMTRYPEWHARDVVALDEAFRGEKISPQATKRRAQLLEEKRARFIGMGLLQDKTDKYALAGEEFLQLYLRLWYEARKYGDLKRHLDLGDRPQTPFMEKADKLVRALAWEVRRTPAIVMTGFSEADTRRTEAIARARRRFVALGDVLTAGKLEPSTELEPLFDCFRLCQFVPQRAPYLLLVLSVRNLENPRESVLLELYFDGKEPLVFPLSLIAGQAEAANILVEEFDSWVVDLPALEELVKAVSGQSFDEVVETGGIFARWFLQSIRQFLEERKQKEDRDKEGGDENASANWVDLYQRGEVTSAVDELTRLIAKNPPRPEGARLYNDRGYIRYGTKGGADDAKRDLERAIDLHHRALPLTLLNLGVMAIDRGDFGQAIERIQDALLITEGKESVSASFLRLRLLRGHLPFTQRENAEQHPANALEAAYVNFAYAVAHNTGHEAAKDILEEGLELLPSSVYLRHALARLYLYRRRADLADPFYDGLARMEIHDSVLANEVKAYRKLGRGFRRKS